MRLLAGILHLIVTTGLAYSVPVLVLGGLAGYFPGFPKGAYAATYVVATLAATFLAGTILGRTRTWRGRVGMLSSLAWVLALAASVTALVKGHAQTITADDVFAPIVTDLAPVFLAVGLTAGLFVGSRHMRPYDQAATPPGDSRNQT